MRSLIMTKVGPPYISIHKFSDIIKFMHNHVSHIRSKNRKRIACQAIELSHISITFNLKNFIKNIKNKNQKFNLATKFRI